MPGLSLKEPRSRLWIAGAALGFALVSLVAWKGLSLRSSIQGDRPQGHSITKLVRYGFTLQNETNRVVERAELWVHVPLKRTATQHLERLEASHPFELNGMATFSA